MKKLSIAFGAFVLSLGLCGLARATTISYTSIPDGGGGLTSPLSNAIVESFNSGYSQTTWTWSGDFARVIGTTAHYAAPAGDGTSYLAVPYNFSSGSATIQFHQAYTYFGLWWGSVDSYNTLAFYNNGVLVAGGTFTGANISNPANGNQVAPSTNVYVNFFDLPAFDSVKLISTDYAFEVDNIAVGRPVPEPVPCCSSVSAWWVSLRSEGNT